MKNRPLQNLSHRQRKITPFEFCRYLYLVAYRIRPGIVSVLWVHRDTEYMALGNLVDLWDWRRDAMTYTGNNAVVCHPPCGPWGKLAWRSKESRSHGIKAMEHVHRCGGVVEQPAGSSLFDEYGLPGGRVIRLNQSDYGHVAVKPTLVYVYEKPKTGEEHTGKERPADSV